MTDFMRPKVTVEDVNDTVTRFIVEPLERGFGDTLGNSMRRVLLSSLTGSRATAIQIDGVQQEFTSIEGVKEDGTEIVMNVKDLIFRATTDEDYEVTAHVSKTGPCVVTGGDLEVPTEFEIVNPDHVICTVADGAQFDMAVRIGSGRGFVPENDNKREGDPIGIIPVDSKFSPVKRCTKVVENTRVGQRTDYERLVLEVETNGAITPTEAVYQGANIINQYMHGFMSLAEDEGQDEEEAPSIFAEEPEETNAELDKQVEDLDLSVRSYNCLKRAGIHSVRQLVEYSENDLLNIRNFGAKSIEEVKDKLATMGLSLKQ